jgi:hypothetical protein
MLNCSLDPVTRQENYLRLMLNCSLDPVTRQENYLRLVLDLLLLPVISAHVRARACACACVYSFRCSAPREGWSRLSGLGDVVDWGHFSGSGAFWGVVRAVVGVRYQVS